VSGSDSYVGLDGRGFDSVFVRHESTSATLQLEGLNGGTPGTMGALTILNKRTGGGTLTPSFFGGLSPNGGSGAISLNYRTLYALLHGEDGVMRGLAFNQDVP